MPRTPSIRPTHLDLADCTSSLAAVAARAESDLAVGDLLRLVQGLPLGYRTVFNLYAVEGYSHAEIGKMLGISEGTSKSQLSRARRLLEDRMLAQANISPCHD